MNRYSKKIKSTKSLPICHGLKNPGVRNIGSRSWTKSQFKWGWLASEIYSQLAEIANTATCQFTVCLLIVNPAEISQNPLSNRHRHQNLIASFTRTVFNCSIIYHQNPLITFWLFQQTNRQNPFI